MNREISFIETKSPDQPVPLKELAEKAMRSINRPVGASSLKDWVIYVSDRRVHSLNAKIRPRSKILMFDRKAPVLDLDIVAETKQWLVLNKPAGLPTQKTLKDFEDNLYDQIRHFFVQQKDHPSGLPYVGLHHRLDRGTSGLVLMTKQRSANKEVSDLFKQRKIEKTYLAHVEKGESKPSDRWRQVDRIRRGSTKKLKFFFEVANEGDEAITEFELVESRDDRHIIRCSPKTGRTHQLRVQLAHHGFPILGDPVYGHKRTAARLMLHAQTLKFPFAGKHYEISSELPAEFL